MLTADYFAAYEEKGCMPELSAKLFYNSYARKTFIAVESRLPEAAQKRFVEEFGGPQLFYQQKQNLLHLFDFDYLEPLPDEPLSEALFWDVMAGLVDFFARLKRCGLVITYAKSEMIFVRRGSYQVSAVASNARSAESSLRRVDKTGDQACDQSKESRKLSDQQFVNCITSENAADFLVFASFQGLREAAQPGDFEQDVLYLGKIAFRLFCRGRAPAASGTPNSSPVSQLFASYPCTAALRSLLGALLAPPPMPRVSIEELQSHALLFTLPKGSLQNAEDLRMQDFVIQRELGRGAFGRAFLAQYTPTNELIALKSCANASLQRSEAQLLARALHPHVVRCYGRVRDGTQDYLVLQYCASGDLFYRVQRGGVPKELCFRWICQLASAMYYMHSVNIMHRDVKLQNILLDGDDAYFSDFNASKSVSLTTKSVVGTPLYYSPEQYYRLEYSKSADVFGLGLVFFDILVGKHPFSGEPADVAKFFSRVKRCGGVGCEAIADLEMRAIVTQMLRYDPRTRFSAADVCSYPAIAAFLARNALPAPLQVYSYTAMPLTPRTIAGASAFAFESALADAEAESADKFSKNGSILADLLPAAAQFAQAYIFSLSRARQSKYVAHACFRAAAALAAKLGVNVRKQDISAPQVILTTDVCAVYLAKLLQTFPALTVAPSYTGVLGSQLAASGITYAASTSSVALAFAAAFLAPNSIKVRARTAVLACGRLIVADEGVLTIQIRGCSKFIICCGKIKGRVQLYIEGTCEVEVYGDARADQIIGVYSTKKHDEVAYLEPKIECLIELLALCYPELIEGAGWSAKSHYW